MTLMAASNDIRLGQLLVQKKLCTLRQVNEALLKQKLLRRRNENLPLGRLLVDGGCLSPEALREVLAEAGVLRLHCIPCRCDYPSQAFAKGEPRKCPSCKADLTILEGPPPPKAPAAPIAVGQSLRPAAPEDAGSPCPSPRRPHPSTEDDGAGPDPHLGKVLGGCQILSRIAQGGMGVVYRAKQLNLGRIVAVKILSQELASDEKFRRRFVEEARSAAQLSHGNIVHINDAGEYQGLIFIVMEYVDGRDLKDLLAEEGRLDIARALDISIQISAALRHAHSRGIIHRDVKPENIMLTRDGEAKLADLGLAKRAASDKSLHLTQDNSLLGTPYYMAPEQAKNFHQVDRRSDIYSLGVTLYKMLTGKVPFDGRSPFEVMIKAIDGKKIPIRGLRDDVPPSLESIVDRMMQRTPEKRYQDIDQVMQDLTAVLHSIMVPARA